MREFVLTVAFLTVFTGHANAEQLSVRSGEHEGFSRLVLPYPRGTTWTVEDSSDGITIRTAGKNFSYDISDVF